MSRNRIKDSQSLHWMGVLKWVVIAAMMSGLGLSYMLCKNQNMHLADETAKLQNTLDTIQRRNQELAGDLEVMKSQSRLEARLKDMRSNLVHWGDLRANWVSLGQDTKARLVRINTMPRAVYNNDSSVVAASATPTQPVH